LAEDPGQAAEGSCADEYPEVRRAWASVAVLYAAYVVAFADRQIIAYLVEPIRADFAISDFQLSLVNGLVFVLIYSLLGIPFGKLADLHERRRVAAIGAGVLSLMILLCARATGLFTLLLARLGVATGEAALAPASVSMIADSFEPTRRGLAINSYAAGMYGGLGLANVFGGAIVAATAAMTGITLPVVGDIEPWQVAFFAIAVPGIVVFVLVLSLQEPARHGRPPARSTRVGLRATLALVRADWFVYFALIIGSALSAIGMFGMYAWVPALFSRVYGWSSVEIGLVFGALSIVLGTSGLLMSGSYADDFIRRGADLVYPRLMMLSVACAIVPGAISMTADSALIMWTCVGAVVFFLSMPFGLAQTAIIAITPNHVRGQLIAVYILIYNFFGLGLGPAIVAGMTDFVFTDDNAVNRSVGLVIVASGVASVLLLALGVKQYEQIARKKKNE